jgi:WS/DGAT/MGAT family acyltransferase
MVSKVHHCLVDGVSGIELLLVTLDVSPDPPATVIPIKPYAPRPLPDRATTLLGALCDDAKERLNRWAGLQKSLVDLAMGGDRTGARNIYRALEMALPYFALPVARAPFNRRLGGKRKLAGSEFSFEEIRAIRGACGGTVNDVVLTVLGGALGRYLELHGQSTRGRAMRVLTPVNVRREGESGTLGNRVSMLLVEVPVGEADPLARLRTISRRTGVLKRSHAGDGLELMTEAMLGWSTPLTAALGKVGPPPNTVANIVCTNVPGPMIPLYCVGHEMLNGYPIVPLGWDLGVGCAVTSYNHMMYFGLMADAEAAPDLHRLKEFLDQSYEELRTAAGIERPQLLRRPEPAAQERRSAA